MISKIQHPLNISITINIAMRNKLLVITTACMCMAFLMLMTYFQSELLTTVYAATGAPIKKCSSNVSVASGKMHACVTLSKSGRVDSTINTWTANSLKGFTGGFTAFFVDKKGNIVDQTKLYKYGVDAKTPFTNYDRTDRQVDNIGAADYKKTAKIFIVLEHTPSDSWNRLIKFTSGLAEVGQNVAKFCASIGGCY